MYWRVTYTDGYRNVPVEVEAPDEERAIMRAGMRRSELTRWDHWFLGFRKPKWTRTSVERLPGCKYCDDPDAYLDCTCDE